jgi:hypothetical protein
MNRATIKVVMHCTFYTLVSSLPSFIIAYSTIYYHLIGVVGMCLGIAAFAAFASYLYIFSMRMNLLAGKITGRAVVIAKNLRLVHALIQTGAILFFKDILFNQGKSFYTIILGMDFYVGLASSFAAIKVAAIINNWNPLSVFLHSFSGSTGAFIKFTCAVFYVGFLTFFQGTLLFFCMVMLAIVMYALVCTYGFLRKLK